MSDPFLTWPKYTAYVAVIVGLAYAGPALLGGPRPPSGFQLPPVTALVPPIVGGLFDPEHDAGGGPGAPNRERSRAAPTSSGPIVQALPSEPPAAAPSTGRPKISRIGRPVYPSGYVEGGKVEVVIPAVEGVVLSGVERQLATLAEGSCTDFGSWKKVSLVNVIPDGRCARFRTVLVEEEGLAVAPAETVVRRDDSGPAPPHVEVSESSANAHAASDTLFVRAVEDQAGTFTVSASAADPESGIADVTLPSIGETPATTEPGERATATYTWTAESNGSTVEADVVTTNGAGSQSEARVQLIPDSAPPAGGSISYAGGLHPDGQVPLTLDPGADEASGVDEDSEVVERQDRRLVHGRCVGPWRGWEVAPADGSVEGAACVRFRYRVSDEVGNERLYRSGAVAQVVDRTPPSAVLSEPLDGATLSGVTVVSADVDDVGFGVARVRFEFAPENSRAHPSWRVIGTASAAPYSAAWDLSDLDPGAYRLRAVAIDRAGNSAASVPVSVTIDGSAEPPLPPEDDEDCDDDDDRSEPDDDDESEPESGAQGGAESPEAAEPPAFPAEGDGSPEVDDAPAEAVEEPPAAESEGTPTGEGDDEAVSVASPS